MKRLTLTLLPLTLALASGCTKEQLTKARTTAESLEQAVSAACATLEPVAELIPEVEEARGVCKLYRQGKAKADQVFDAVAACDLEF